MEYHLQVAILSPAKLQSGFNMVTAVNCCHPWLSEEGNVVKLLLGQHLAMVNILTRVNYRSQDKIHGETSFPPYD